MTERTNRLAGEKSPYLRQHAGNPVDWFPWRDEAFRKAAGEDKPVFLSIGYSACHWCHVMEKESFEDPDVAALLNAAFVSVKVDREERPDLDHYYMSVCQRLTGSGGWPLTIVMTPQKLPFFAGTYFPKSSKFGRPGLVELLPRLTEIWRSHRDDALNAAERISILGAPDVPAADDAPPDLDLLRRAFEDLADEYDPEEGGFGSAPKFPMPDHLLFLLRFWKRTGETRALGMVEKTLTRMRRGGIFDQLGAGFHRYSTDRAWRLPHFEKMLYDQAMLVMACTEAFQATGDLQFRRTADETLAYVLRDLRSSDGSFYTSEDADSEGEEGKFYLWTAAELARVLPAADGELALKAFGMSESGPGTLTCSHTLETLGSQRNMETGELARRLERITSALREVRDGRTRPQLDTKILADWNGLMIAALAKAAQAFDAPHYARAAAAAAGHILKRTRRRDGSLRHVVLEGESRIPAFLDDYAFLVWGLIELYEAGFNLRWLKAALGLCRYALDHFWDAGPGGFFFTSDSASELSVRRKEEYDGVYPSGNAVMALNMLRLGRMTGDALLEDKGAQLIQAFSSSLRRSPAAHSFWMTALDFALGPSLEIVIAGRPRRRDTASLLVAARRSFAPRKVVLFRPTDRNRPAIAGLAPFTQAMSEVSGQAAAYVCSNFSCRQPVTDAAQLRILLS